MRMNLDRQFAVSRKIFFAILMACCLLAPLPAAAQSSPWPNGEKLEMEIYWPSGVSMGEASLEAGNGKDTFNFSATVEVGLPQGQIIYKFSSTAGPNLCSREFRRSVERGGKSWEEITKFDAVSGMASVTRDGNTRELAAPKCARDPLTYLYYFRTQAASDKRPSAASLFLAGPLEVQVSLTAKENFKIKRVERSGEHYQIHYPSAMGQGIIELWLDGTPRQTPIGIKLPLPLATFSAELR